MGEHITRHEGYSISLGVRKWIEEVLGWSKRNDRLLSDAESAQVASHWGEHTSASDAFSSDVYWLAVPEVQRRHQFRLTGGASQNWIEFVVREHLPHPLPVNRVLSLGCGDGILERTLAQLGAFRRCDAYDISPGAIEQARKLAEEAGYSHIGYEVEDLNRIHLPDRAYDSVWFNGSLHHVSALERVLDGIRRTLKPEGLLVFNEYVGPNHFDFTPRQKEVLTAAFAIIPKKFRKSFLDRDRDCILDNPPIPDPDEVRAKDPSEAVRSSEIMDAVSQRFDIVLHRQAGGTILQFLLGGIAGNFRSDDAASMRILKMLFEIEDGLMETGDIQSDFVLVVAKPKK
jgi:2-polyprenyl-3-methyl-5-hydroxy-6-metoxy-1,4-benzoquinol methylase